MQGLSDRLQGKLHQALPVELRHVPERIADVASALNLRCALTGGLVRDLLRLELGQITRDDFVAAVHDFDIVVEGLGQAGSAGGTALAYELVRRLPGKLTVNPSFQTASIHVQADSIEIDIASARREEYPAPGQLPQVDTISCSIEQDLPRRDFSINALALELHPAPGVLVDPLGGIGDLRDRLLRVLHSRSFVDDPTRLLRAIRYSMRLNYDLEAVTREQYAQAIDDGVLDCLSPERVRYELECIANEPRWVEVWGVMDLTRLTDGLAEALGGVSVRWALDDAQALDIALKNQSKLLEQDGLEPWIMRTGWLLRSVPDAQLQPVAERIGLYPKQIALLQQVRRLLHDCAYQLAGELRPSQVVQLLERWPRAAAAAALFTYTNNVDSARMTRRQLLRYLDTWCHVRGELDGHALLALGAAPGKQLGELRDFLRYARLDGDIVTAEEEAAVAVNWIRQHASLESPDSEVG